MAPFRSIAIVSPLSALLLVTGCAVMPAQTRSQPKPAPAEETTSAENARAERTSTSRMMDHVALGSFAPPAADAPGVARLDDSDPMAEAAFASSLGRAYSSAHAGGPARHDGSNLTQVSFSLEGADFDPDASPDGRFVVFASTQHRPTADIYVKSLTGRTVTQLTSNPSDDLMPSVSPDGSRIAFASNRSNNWDIYVISSSGGSAIQVTSDAAHELHPSWSPDGTHVVFSRLGAVSNRWEMWVTDVTNPGVAHFIGYGLFPEWCPVAGTGLASADKIVFQRSRERGDRAFAIWTIDYADGRTTNPTEIASSPIAACINPGWSLDGRWISFATVPTPRLWDFRDPLAAPPSADIWMIDDEGQGLVRLTSSESVDLMPSWAPDGQLLFVSNRGGIDNIWSLDAADAILAASGEPSPNPSLITAAPQYSGAPEQSLATQTGATGAENDEDGESITLVEDGDGG